MTWSHTSPDGYSGMTKKDAILFVMNFFNESYNFENTIDVYISNPDHVLFKGKAMGFSSYNEAGEFSIISNHTNFRSLVKNKITIYVDKNTKKELVIETGVLSYSNNSLEVYVT